MKLFTCAQVTNEDIRRPFIPMVSISKSSKWQCEETIVSNFYQFLKICDRETVQRKFNDMTKRRKSREVSNHWPWKDVLKFLTGFRNVPLGGIEGSIVLDHDILKGARVKANTCTFQLAITVNKRYYTDESATFISHYANDILDGQGYGGV